MKKNWQISQKTGMLYSFCLSLILGILILVIGFCLGKGTFYLGTDYNLQQVVFNAAANQAIKEGDVLWSDEFDLGTSFVGAYSFYNLGSPFFLLSLLFPASLSFLYTPLLLCLKLAVAGISSYCYISQYVKQKKWAVVASLLYSFSSYQLANLNYHFQDILALFPFLLLALDLTVTKGKKGIFCVMVAVMAFTNYFFFVGIVVFLLLYFCVKWACGEYKINISMFIQLAIESVLGVMIAAVILLPTWYFIVSNPRTGNSIFHLPEDSSQGFIFLKPHQYVDLIHAFILPSECIMNRGMILQSNPTASEAYLPLFGIVPTVAYLFSHKKTWITKLCVVLFCLMLFSVTNSIFVAFNSEYYARWFFMMILLFCVATAIQMDEQKKWTSGFIVTGILFAMFYGARLLWKFYYKVEFFPNKLLAGMLIGISTIGLVMSYVISKNLTKKYIIEAILVGIFGSVCVTFALNTYYMHKYWNSNQLDISVADFFSAQDLQYPDDNEYYRVDTRDVYGTMGIYTFHPNINSFSSTVSGSVFDFYKESGYSRTVNSILPTEAYGFRTLLGVKYFLSQKQQTPIVGFSEKPVFQNQGIYFYENQQFAGMGFLYDSIISLSEYRKISKEDKHLAILDSMVLEDNVFAQYSDKFVVKNSQDYQDCTLEQFQQWTFQRKSSAVKNFSYNKGKYSMTIISNKDTLAFISIPYDHGFSALVNGKVVPIEKVNTGFVGIPIMKGENKIVLSYFPQGLTSGICISVLGGILFGGYIFLMMRNNKNEKI